MRSPSDPDQPATRRSRGPSWLPPACAQGADAIVDALAADPALLEAVLARVPALRELGESIRALRAGSDT